MNIGLCQIKKKSGFSVERQGRYLFINVQLFHQNHMIEIRGKPKPGNLQNSTRTMGEKNGCERNSSM